jgi:CRISPR system Cascade subunit CasB
MRDDDAMARAARAWWTGLQRSFPDGRRNPTGDAGALARLRRASTVHEAAVELATLRLLEALGDDERMLERAALCAAVLAHVREDRHGQHPAAAVGSDPPAMSALRFNRLTRTDCDAPDDMLVQFRRLVALADRKVDVATLAAALLDWSPATRLRWIYAWHGAGRAAPADADASSRTPETQVVPQT